MLPKTFENDIIARCDVSETLRANTRACEVFGHRFYFDAFSTVHTNTHIYAFVFSNRCVCNENALRIGADGRPKHIEMYAFSFKRIGVDKA